MKNEFTFKISDDTIDMLHNLIDETKSTMYQCITKFPNGEEKKFDVKKIKINLKKYYKKRGGKYKLFLKPYNELIFEGVCKE